jgi:predicted ABC-type ATPase
MSKKIIIIAGPNGAGKTTFARSFLPEEAQCTRFINTDLCEPVFPLLADAETTIARVAERVRQGGHDIPAEVIRRRFTAGLRNLENRYKSAVDTWAKYDNVGERPTVLEWGVNE